MLARHAADSRSGENSTTILFKACANAQDTMRKADDKPILLVAQATIVEIGRGVGGPPPAHKRASLSVTTFTMTATYFHLRGACSHGRSPRHGV
jgi:hypothetical protein